MLRQRRSIGFWGAFSIVAGSMLGIGIFLSPGEMARSVSSPWIFLGIWLAAGVIVIGGAVAYAELGTRFPKAGGDYVFHREAFGSSVAFATGWGLFGAIFSGSIAAVAVAIWQYQLSALTGFDFTQTAFELGSHGISWAQVMGCGLVLALTALNARGVEFAAWAQQVTTLTPVLLLFVLAVAVLVMALSGHLPEPVSPSTAVASTAVPLTIGGVVTAYLAAYFAYSGWNAVIYVAGEVESPQKNIPRALLGGTLTITAMYLLLCVAFLAVLGMDGLATGKEASASLARVLGGGWMGGLMNILVLLCLLATLNGSILGGGRVAFAMGRDGVFVRLAGRLNRETGVPTVALWLQAAWSIVLVLTNRFEDLLFAVSLTMVATGALTVIALWRIRRRDGCPDGVYRAFGWPWLPGLFLLSSVLVIIGKIISVFQGARANPLIGLGVLVAAYVAHALYVRVRRR
ncbi:MAG: APA family basic amino acid/polyamine antiporter [Bradymonadia bacterium]|jgi:APA family basic amino acid/polyamine antiporter